MESKSRPYPSALVVADAESRSQRLEARSDGSPPSSLGLVQNQPVAAHHQTPGQEMMSRVAEGLKTLTPQQPLQILNAGQGLASPAFAGITSPQQTPTSAALRSPRYPMLSVPQFASPAQPIPTVQAASGLRALFMPPGSEAVHSVSSSGSTESSHSTSPSAAGDSAEQQQQQQQQQQAAQGATLTAAAATAGIGLPLLGALSMNSPRSTTRSFVADTPPGGMQMLRRASIALPVGPMLTEEAQSGARMRDRRASLPVSSKRDVPYNMWADQPF
jgi:hypothetical protein